MSEKEKRIVIRLDEKTWHLLDDKRHSERVSFQILGERLFLEWSKLPVVPKSEQNHSVTAVLNSGSSPASQPPLPEEIAKWIPLFVAVMLGPARRALEANLETFAEYTALKGGPHAPPPGKSVHDAVSAAQRDIEAVDIAKAAAERHRGPGKRRETA